MLSSKRYMTNTTNDLKRRRKIGGRLILFINFLERLAFFSILANLLYILNADPFAWGSSNASLAVLIFTGVTFTSTLLGGYLADCYFGKFSTITFGLTIYSLFYSGLPFLFINDVRNQLYHTNTSEAPAFCDSFTATWKNKSSKSVSFSSYLMQSVGNMSTVTMELYDKSIIQENCGGFVMIVLIGIGIGGGFVKAVLAPFGAAQMRTEGPEQVRVYFGTFTWLTNFGSLLAFSIIAYIQQNISTFIGYFIPWLLLCIAAMVHIIGIKIYDCQQVTKGSILKDIFHVVKEATWRKIRSRTGKWSIFRDSIYNDSHSESSSTGVIQSDHSDYQIYNSPLPGPVLHHSEQYRYDPFLKQTVEISSTADFQPTTAIRFLDLAKFRYGGSHHESTVEDVRIIIKSAFLMTFLIPFWLVYFQMESQFLVQGLHLNLQVFHVTGKYSYLFNVPVASIQLFGVIVVLTSLPLLTHYIYPCIDRYFQRPFTKYLRMLVGMFFSLTAVIIAGILEDYRWHRYQDSPNDRVIQKIGHTEYYAADFSIFLQIPQYSLIGLAEAFTIVAGFEYAYSQAPKAMQSVLNGIFFFISGISSMLGALILSAFKGIFFFDVIGDESNSDPNCNVDCGKESKCQCQLYNYFYVLGGIQGAGIIAFIILGLLMKDKEIDVHSNYQQQCLVTSNANANASSTPVVASSSRVPAAVPYVTHDDDFD